LDDKKAGMIEFIKYQEIQTSHKGPILAICKIGQFLVSGGSDEQLLAWDILLDSNLPGHEGEVQPYHMSLPNAGDIRSIHVLNDDVLAVACGKNIILYNSSLQTMKVIKGYHGNIRCVTFSLDGLFLVSAYNDGTICLWNVNDGVCIETWPGHGGFLVCGLDFQRSSLASVGSDGTVAIWDISRFC
jgi:WD40 repeat protein